MASGPNPNHQRGTWWVQWFDGKRWRRTTVARKRPGWKPGDPMPKKPPATAQAALAMFVRKEEAARRSRAKDPEQTISQFLLTYVEAYAGRAESSTEALTRTADSFMGWCEGRKIKRLLAVTASVCQEWIAYRAAGKDLDPPKPRKHSTLTRDRAILSGAWSGALKREELDRNPWKLVTIPGKAEKKKRESWTREQYEQLLTKSKPWLRDLLIFGCHAGLRIEALRMIEWRDIRWASATAKGFGFVVVRPELDKAGKGYQVPICKALHDMLTRRQLHKTAHVKFVLTGMHGKPLGCNNVTGRGITRACERAKLERPQSPNHHMRRTFGRWAVLGHLTGRPIPLFVVSRWMGHASVRMTEHYLEMNFDDSAAWMEDYSAPGNAADGQTPEST